MIVAATSFIIKGIVSSSVLLLLLGHQGSIRIREYDLHFSELFTADRELKVVLSIYTRQNSAGTRRGFEVPEERDYYPYWGPMPWRDIAIMVSDKKTEQLMKEYVNSPNYGHKCECS